MLMFSTCFTLRNGRLCALPLELNIVLLFVAVVVVTVVVVVFVVVFWSMLCRHMCVLIVPILNLEPHMACYVTCVYLLS